MKREDRAKQFLPFDAMKGLDAAMRRVEELAERTERIELGEEDAEELSSALSRLTRGDKVTATYYRAGRYLTHRGTVTRIDTVRRTLTMDDGVIIPFDDLFSLTSDPR